MRVLAILLLALASVTTAAGCGTMLPAAKLCELGFLPTQPVVTGPNVLGTMWAKCAPDRPDSHHLVLSLEWKTRGADWSVSASEVSDKIPAGSEPPTRSRRRACRGSGATRPW